MHVLCMPNKHEVTASSGAEESATAIKATASDAARRTPFVHPFEMERLVHMDLNQDELDLVLGRTG